MESNGFTLRFYLLGHCSGECYFPQRSDMESFLRAIDGELVRYSYAPGDYRGKEASYGTFRSFNGPEANHYD
jgi:hypothetical protein